MLRWLLGLCALGVLSLGATGCSTSALLERPPAWHVWSQKYGGVLESAQPGDNARISRALATIAPMCGCQHTSVRVLDDDAVGAFAWRDGSLFLTRGLLATMDDAELTAALAHELGHLVEDVRRQSDGDVEAHADAWGVGVLERSGLPARSMIRMLVKLESQSDPGFQAGIRARIQLLEERVSQQIGAADVPREAPPS